jgi:hypothetical protein
MLVGSCILEADLACRPAATLARQHDGERAGLIACLIAFGAAWGSK